MWEKYHRTNIAEMRSVTSQEAQECTISGVSISQEDINAGSPKLGDMIARNPQNHDDQWLVAEKYFKDNFAWLENHN